MSATSFQFRYPLNRNPYVAENETPILYPYPQFGEFATSSDLYVYGRAVPFRSYFGQDLNMTARPISRVIQPEVVEYAPIVSPTISEGLGTPVTISPTTVTMGNRFTALNAGEQQAVPLKLWGAQVAPLTDAQKQRALILVLLLLGVAGALILFGRKSETTQQQ